MKKLTPFIIALFLLDQTAVWGGNLPAGYESVSGSSSYSVSEDGSTGTLTAGDAVTIGQWNQGFNIAAGHTFNAHLPANGVHLSRDITANPSEIFGTLNVPQGRFFLVNTSGVYFAPGSSVNAAGLVASALDMNDQDFLSGNYRFAQGADPASVVNAGTMTIGAGGVALLGGAVENRGLIVANESSVVLASGKEMILSLDPGGLLSVLVTKEMDQAVSAAGVTTVEDGVRQTGIIRAAGGKVLLTASAARDIFKNLVNHDGLIEAGSVRDQGGVVELVAAGAVETRGTIRTGDLIISEGAEVSANDTDFFIEGDWVNGGSFDGGTSTVRFTGAGGPHHVYGSSDFYNVAAEGADRVIRFEAGALQTVSGSLALQGEFARLLKIHSTVEGSEYLIDVRGDYALDFVDVRDSHQLGGDEILITRSHSDGNIFGWNADPDWTGDGLDNNWSTGLNWDSGVAPGAGNTVTFNGTAVPNGDKNSTVDAGFGGSIAILTIGAGYSGTITLARSLTLTGAGTNTLTQNGGTLDLNGQTLSMDNNYEMNGGTFQATGGGSLNITLDFVQTGGTFNAGSSTFDVGRDFTVSAGTFNADTANIFLDEELTISGTGVFNEGTSSVTLDGGNGTIDVLTSETFNNLTINSTGTKTISAGDTLIVLGALNLTDGVVNTGTLEARGNVVVGAAFNSGNAPLVFTGTNAQTFDLTGAAALFDGHITVNKTSGIVTLLSNLTMNAAGQDLNVTSGTLDLGTFDLTVADQLTIDGGTLTHGAGAITASNDFTQSGGAFNGGAGNFDVNDAFTLSGGTFTAPSGTLFVGGNWTHTAGGTFTHNSGTVTFDSGNDTIDVSTTETFASVVFANGVKTVAAGDTLIVTGTLDLTDGSINTGTVAAQGDINQASTFDGGNGLLLINGTGSQLFTGSATTTTGNLPDLTINKTSGTLTLAGTIRTDNSGAGAWTYTAGTIDPGSSTVVFNNSNTITGSHSLNDIIFRGGGTKTINSGDTLTALGTLTLDSGAINTGTLNAQGHVDVEAAFGGGSALLTFTGAAAQNFDLTGAESDFNADITINKSLGTVTLLSNLDMNAGSQDLFVTSGGLDLGAFNLDVDGAGSVLNIGGGTLTHGTGTITATSFNQSSGTFSGGSGNMDVNGSFDLSGGAFTSTSGILFVGGNWTHTAGGTFTHNSGTVTFDSGNDTIDVSTTETFASVVFANGVKTVAAGDTLIVTGTLDLTDGSINTGTVAAQGDINQASTFDGGNGLLLINGTGSQLFTGSATTTTGNLPDLTINKTSGTLTLAGTIRTSGSGAGAWTYTAGILDPGTSTVIFNGTNTITGSHSLNDIIFRGGGTKTINSGDTLTALGTLTLDDGTINTGTLEAKGDIVQEAAADGGSALLLINGTGSQLFTGNATTATGNLPDLTIDKPSGTLTLAGTIRTSGSGAGAWTYTAGTLDPGTSTVVFNGTNTITGSHDLYNVEFPGSGTITVNAGDTLTVLNSLTLTDGSLNGGTIDAKGDVIHSALFDGGNGTISITGAAVRIIDLIGGGQMPNVILNAPNVTLNGPLAGTVVFDGGFTVQDGAFVGDAGDINLNSFFTLEGGSFTAPSGTMFVAVDWTHTLGGTFAHNSGTVELDGGTAAIDVAVTETFNNLTVSAGTKNITAGDTLIILGLLNLVNGNIHTGTLEARGDVTFGSSLDATTTPLVFTGTADQLLDPGPTLNAFDSDITINKTSGKVTLAADLGMNDAGQDLVILSGELDLAGFNFIQTGGGAVLDIQGGTLTQGTGNITASSFNQSGGLFAVGGGTLDVNGNFALSGGMFTAPPAGSSFTVSGDFSNTGGVFDANFGELVLDGGDQVISGATIFYDLTKIVAVTQTLTFESGSTQIITGTTTLQGTPSDRLLLRSSTGGSQWFIDPQGTRAIEYVDVMDSVNLNPVFILPSNSVDSGNNVRWFPVPPPPPGVLLGPEYTSTHFPLFQIFFSDSYDTGTLQGLLRGSGLKDEYWTDLDTQIDTTPFDEAFYSTHGASPLPGDTIKPHDRLELAIWLPKSPRSEATA